jgi:hypothetical protein
MKTVYMIIGHKCWFALIYHLWVSLKNLQDQVWLAIWSIGHLYCTWVSDPEDGLHHPLLCFLAFTFTLDSLSITLWFLLFAWKRTKWLRKVQHRLLVTDREGLIFMYCVVLYFFFVQTNSQLGWWRWLCHKVLSYDLQLQWTKNGTSACAVPNSW